MHSYRSEMRVSTVDRHRPNDALGSKILHDLGTLLLGGRLGGVNSDLGHRIPTIDAAHRKNGAGRPLSQSPVWSTGPRVVAAAAGVAESKMEQSSAVHHNHFMILLKRRREHRG
jgi:hypothetical protein